MAKKILIVDDDTGFVSRILNLVGTSKHSFSVADSLNRARYLLGKNKFDLILANVKVPGGNSLDLKASFNKTSYNADFWFMSSLDSDYDYVVDRGEKCYHKYDYENSLRMSLENA